ncbi:WD repeat-containing protein 6 [Megalops cyprinoides]|uniref:WD repeat-containing protein 6 n=1 Tax=Megalops cyprinoides TaxID=118141 RepID=UPI001864B16B|nr:WD repeat-containing protein 6 [Megalops cyprinoides]
MAARKSPLVMESVLLVAPVTALEFLEEDYLLAGEGPTLSVYSLRTLSVTCTSLTVLQNQCIHGLRLQIWQQGEGACVTVTIEDELLASPWQQLGGVRRTVLAVFGGKAVRVVELREEVGVGTPPVLKLLGPLTELQDWVCDVRWLSGGGHLLAVALAHNIVLLLEAEEGQTLVLCPCQEGCLLYSALLLGWHWDNMVVVGGTVFNQLVIWRPGGAYGVGREQGEEEAGQMKPVERRLSGHKGVIFGLAYHSKQGLLASASDDRSVRIWGVGTLGGAAGCGALCPPCLQVLYGHQARVFSVQLSPGQVFSAGEDGTCLQWDWERGQVERALKGHRAGGVRALAVSNERSGQSRLVATGGADGGIRLWNLGNEDGGHGGVQTVVDLGFEGRGCPKVVRVVSGDWREGGVVVSTDQGVVYLWEEQCWKLLLKGRAEFQSYSVMEVLSFDQPRTGLCALGGLNGVVSVFPLSQPSAVIHLRAGAGKVHNVLWARQGGKAGYLFVSAAEGKVYRWYVKLELGERGLELRAVQLCAFLLPPCAKRWLTAVAFVLQSEGSLWVCGDRRGSLLLYRDSREEKAGEREEVEETVSEESTVSNRGVVQPVNTLFGAHGKQGVTWVCEHQGVLYSCGRDGCVRVLRVGGERFDMLEVLRVQRACQGMEWIERVLILDLVEERDGWGGEGRIVILGFHSVFFVVWDPIQQERLMSVPCGGGHRSWSYCPPSDLRTTGTGGSLLFVKQGTVLATQGPQESFGSGRLWLKEGLHGKGVGCICHLGWVGIAGMGRCWEILVTGGEDTRLSVLAVQPQSGAVRVLSIITDHISNVRTLAAIRQEVEETNRQRNYCSKIEGQTVSSLSALLLSAGGRAQLQCYRLLIRWTAQLSQPTCQVIQIASHHLDEELERRRNRHKTLKMDPETRYMSLDVVQDGTVVLLALGCSDGAVRLFSVTNVDGRFRLLWESFYHQRCVLSVVLCCLQDPQGNRRLFLFSGATDGRIAVWDISTVINWNEDMTSASTWKGPSSPCLTFTAHQSGVNTLAIWERQSNELKPAKKGWEVGWMTLASGGDDGQLSVVIIRVEFHQQDVESSIASLQLHSSSAVPLAHSAPLTALGYLSPWLLVSTSPDQRVCLWSLHNGVPQPQAVVFSHVADVAGLEVWPCGGQLGRSYVAVCGQGLQLLQLKEREE